MRFHWLAFVSQARYREGIQTCADAFPSVEA